jgi:ribonuclease BN (tRNA processing enzyme)
VVIYRIEWRDRAVVYATDTEGYVSGDRRLVRFARGADLLIHDAQYRQDHYLGSWELASVTQGFGHSTAAMACKVAADAGVDHLVLFHHDPNYDDAVLEDVQVQARAIFPCSDVAREGMEIVFSSSSMQSEAQTFRQLAV